MKLQSKLVDALPKKTRMESGVFYYCESGNTSTHLCPCGCNRETFIAFSKNSTFSITINENNEITIHPDIARLFGCKSRYQIKNNIIIKK